MSTCMTWQVAITADGTHQLSTPRFTANLTEAEAFNENLFLQPTIYNPKPEPPTAGTPPDTKRPIPEPKFLTPEEEEEQRQKEEYNQQLKFTSLTIALIALLFFGHAITHYYF